MAIGADHRLDSLPNVSAFTELGLLQANLKSTFGIFPSLGTPKEVVQTLNKAFNKALFMPDVLEIFEKSGNMAVGGDAQEFVKTNYYGIPK